MRISLPLDAGDGRSAGGGSGHGADDTEGVLFLLLPGGGVSVVEFDRRGKAAKATRELVDTVRDAAGFPKE